MLSNPHNHMFIGCFLLVCQGCNLQKIIINFNELFGKISVNIQFKHDTCI